MSFNTAQKAIRWRTEAGAPPSSREFSERGTMESKDSRSRSPALFFWVPRLQETRRWASSEGVMNPGPSFLACAVLVMVPLTRLPAQEPGKEDVWKYHEPFQGPPRQTKDFRLLGADAAQCVKYEADGVRIAMPAGKARPTTGVATTFGLRGDFDVRVRYEVFQEPEPVDAGQPNTGTRISLTVKLDAESEAAIRRKVTPKDPVHILTWRKVRLDGELKPKGGIFPVTQKQGRLRMERKGTELTYYLSEGDDNDFKLLTTFPFVADDVQSVQLFGETSSPK